MRQVNQLLAGSPLNIAVEQMQFFTIGQGPPTGFISKASGGLPAIRDGSLMERTSPILLTGVMVRQRVV